MLPEWSPLISAGLKNQVRPEINHFWQVTIPINSGYVAENIVQSFIFLNLTVEGFHKQSNIRIVSNVFQSGQRSHKEKFHPSLIISMFH